MLFNFTLISWVFIFMFYCVVGIFIFIPAVLGKNTNKLDTCDKSLMFIFWPITIIAIIFAAANKLEK